MDVKLDDFKEQLRKEMIEFKSQIEQQLKTELTEMKDSLDFLNKQYEETKEQNERLEKENKALKKENDALKTEYRNAKKQLDDHESRILTSEQYSRNRNLEIKGIKEEKNENLTSILSHIGTALNEPVTANDIEVCHRVQTRNENASPNIIVQFKHRAKRDSLLQKARKVRLSTTDIGWPEENPIYVNEHLCPTLKKLMFKTTERKKACGWKFAWTRDGKIFARKEEQSTVIHIRNERDLEKIE